MRRLLAVLVLLAASCFTAVAAANHIPGQPCNGCVSHKHWPRIDGVVRKAKWYPANFVGTSRSDELLGHVGSDTLRGGEGSDVLWGDWDKNNQPPGQSDQIFGGGGNDFIYASHGSNTIDAGAGNDAISGHYGSGTIDCGPGRDVYHVPRSRKQGWTARNCEKVDYRSEKQRGGGLKPLR